MSTRAAILSAAASLVSAAPLPIGDRIVPQCTQISPLLTGNGTSVGTCGHPSLPCPSGSDIDFKLCKDRCVTFDPLNDESVFCNLEYNEHTAKCTLVYTPQEAEASNLKQANLANGDNYGSVGSDVGERQFDYIIVGAGPAGCTAARALATSPGSPSVLLVERGLPQASASSTKTGNTWPQVVNDKSAAEALRFTGGVWGAVARVEGGGTSVNDGLFIEESHDYFEANFPGSDADAIMRGYAKASVLSSPAGNSTLGDVYVEAILQAGRGPIIDADGKEVPLAGAQGSVGSDAARKKRPEGHGTWLAYSTFDTSAPPISPRHPASDLISELVADGRITLATSTLAEAVLWADSSTPTATGVRLKSNEGQTGSLGLTGDYGARKAVVLSAGAIYTPYLLMKSGVGPRSVLDAHPGQISPRVYNDNVGANFIDRPVVNFAMTLNSSSTSPFCSNGKKIIADAVGVELKCVPRFLGRAVSGWNPI